MIALRSGESTSQIVRTAETDGVIVSTTRDPVIGRVNALHYHENPHLCLLVEGADVEVRGGRSYQRRTGDLHFYHAGESHASHSLSRRSTSALVEFSGDFLARYELSETQLARAACENLDAPFVVLQMQRELQSNDLHTPTALHALALELVDYSRIGYERTPPRWVRHVTELLHARWSGKVSLTELAVASGVHPVTISKYFRTYFSCTLGKYRRRLMVRRSMPLIRESGMTLSEIAYACGFADQSHFTRTFRQVTGLLPGAFRRL